uniref:Uncharacterized protein n=1 Tax=viral metagenome TaxID=1070528 RepID=A0A6M3KX77_9ZZZZ
MDRIASFTSYYSSEVSDMADDGVNGLPIICMTAVANPDGTHTLYVAYREPDEPAKEAVLSGHMEVE